MNERAFIYKYDLRGDVLHFVVLCYYSALPELYIGFYFYLCCVELFNRLLMYSDLE